MSDQFHHFAKAVAAQFALMSKGELYTVAIDKDAFYEFYQNSFPTGTNEVFRTAREHECSTCRSFIKNIGNVVSITRTGLLTTVWDNLNIPEPYASVSNALMQFIQAQKIEGIFRSEQPQYGAAQTKELFEGKPITWNHFVGKVDAKHYAGNEAAKKIGEARSLYNVFKRGLTELKKEAVSDVLELLNQKLIYRGEEFAFALGQLYGMQGKYNEQGTAAAKEAYIWANINEAGARLRNTAFGTLLIDLSGVPERTDETSGETFPAKAPLDMESALKAYEKVMAPENYKRPTALITPRMVEDAMKTVTDMGIEPALHRRFATIADVSINDILFVDNAVRGKMKDGSIAGLLMDAAKPTYVADPKDAENVTIEQFIEAVLPTATSMSLLVKNAHQPNFVSLTTAADPNAPLIFKWNSPLAWSYDGNITDSIKERVKAAGGRTSAVLRVSLAWSNADDLDLHVIEPDRNEIYFGSRGRKSANTGELDVDMNRASSGHEYSGTEPVENVTWSRPMDGAYRVVVHNYNKRTTNNPGFTLEVESATGVHQYSCAKSPASGQANPAMVVTVKGGVVTAVTPGAGVIGGSFSQEKWGVNTEQYVKVDTMMLSPNHQDKAVGNKHFIFILEGCKNPVPTRGLYNEFLLPALDKHRKVFEVLGNKTMCEPTDQQLSGLGFSRAGETVTVQVNGRKSYNVRF